MARVPQMSPNFTVHALMQLHSSDSEACVGIPLSGSVMPTASSMNVFGGWLKEKFAGMMGRASKKSDQPEQPPKDPLVQLVSLQKASGCWVLDPHLAAALGKTSEEVEKPKPASVKRNVWATILALIWLHGFKIDAQEEWELLAMKAVSWLRAQRASGVTECVEAGNALLGCNVHKDAVGI